MHKTVPILQKTSSKIMNTPSTTTSTSKLSKSTSNGNIANIVSLSSSSGSSHSSNSAGYSASVPTNKFFILDNYIDLSSNNNVVPSTGQDVPSITKKQQILDSAQSLPLNVHNFPKNFENKALEIIPEEKTSPDKAPIQKSYRDIKARYFTSLKLAQQKHQLQVQAHKDSVQTHFRMDEEPMSPHFQDDEEFVAPSNNSSTPSLLTMALKEEARDSKNAFIKAQQMRRNPSMDDVSSTYKEQKLSKLLSENESYRRPAMLQPHPDTADSFMEGHQFLPPHLLAERNRSDFSVYQQNKQRDLQKKAVMFEAL